MAIAQFLEDHPAINKVYYPALASHPQAELVARQMNGMGGGVLSFELKNGYRAGVDFIKKLQIFQNAASLGGVDSLAIHPAAMWGGRLDDSVADEQGISAGMIRMSVGIEAEQDLITDLKQALS